MGHRFPLGLVQIYAGQIAKHRVRAEQHSRTELFQRHRIFDHERPDGLAPQRSQVGADPKPLKALA